MRNNYEQALEKALKHFQTHAKKKRNAMMKTEKNYIKVMVEGDPDTCYWFTSSVPGDVCLVKNEAGKHVVKIWNGYSHVDCIEDINKPYNGSYRDLEVKNLGYNIFNMSDTKDELHELITEIKRKR